MCVLNVPNLIKEYKKQVPGRGRFEETTAAVPSSAVSRWRVPHRSRARCLAAIRGSLNQAMANTLLTGLKKIAGSHR